MAKRLTRGTSGQSSDWHHAIGYKTDFMACSTGIAAGSPVPVDLMKQLIDKLNLTELTVAYGMSMMLRYAPWESGSLTHIRFFFSGDEVRGSLQSPLPAFFRVTENVMHCVAARCHFIARRTTLS